MKRTILPALLPVFVCLAVAWAQQERSSSRDASAAQAKESAWEADNPIRPVPEPPLGLKSWDDVGAKPKPESVRLGRWLFFDKRLSADGDISCATCHRPEHAFSEPTPVSTGIKGQQGTRKSPSTVNHSMAIAQPDPVSGQIVPFLFWDGRAHSLEEQAKGPIANPIEMGHTHEQMVKSLSGIKGYRKYFKEAFGSDEITIDRVAQAIADYERTLMSGNSANDRFASGDESALSEQARLGRELFFGKARCNNCHLGPNFTDGSFHNLGIGWDEKTQKFADDGRALVTKENRDRGAFKTPGLRDVTKHAPYMHDGSLKTLRDVVQHYEKGGHRNPFLDPKLNEPLELSSAEVDALVAFMEALDGEGYLDRGPDHFPQ